MPNITDELAGALKELYGIIAVKPSLVAKWPVCTEKARAALARYDAAKTQQTAADWLESNYPGIRAEWEDSVGTALHIWLQQRYPDVWVEYVRECGNV